MSEQDFNYNNNAGYNGTGTPNPAGQPWGAGTPNPNFGKKPAKASGGRNRMVAWMLVCALLGGCVGGGGTLLGAKLLNGGNAASAMSNTTSLVESSRANVETVQYSGTGEKMTNAQIYEANVNSCVGITGNVSYNVWGYTTTAAVSGSGFVLTADGYIVTNYHVVEGTSDVTVTMYDGTTYPATVVGYDSSNDVAVLMVDAQNLTPVVLGKSEDLNVGDNVVAIGNPLGELTFSLTSGGVSALNREITLSAGTMNLIQTDCAINSGNSGGPMFNEYGEVVGIVNAKYSSSSSSSEASIDNIGFAIPIDNVIGIIQSIIENGYVVKPYLGVTLYDYSYPDSQGNQVSGAMVYSVVEGEAAEAAGLSRGDVITAINGEEVTSSSDATAKIGRCEPGETITISIDRNGEKSDVSVTLGERQQSATEDSDSSSSQQSQQQQSQQGGGQYNPFGAFGGNGF